VVFSPEVKKESESAKCFIRNNEKEGINVIATINADRNKYPLEVIGI
jgi:hypothetical protein